MQNYKKIAIAVSFSLAATSCSTTGDYGGISTGTMIGCAGGLIVGGLAGKVIGGNEGAWIGAGVGALVGCSLGYYWAQREAKLAEAAQKQGVDVEFERIGAAEGDGVESMVAVQSKAIIAAENSGQKEKIEHVVGKSEIVGLSATVKGDIFRTGQTSISSQKHKRFFSNYAETVKTSDSAVLIVGHTDNTGSAKVNADVSLKRARSVAEELIRNGIPQENIYIYGAGESQPIASNTTTAGRADNRRIEVVTLSNKPEYVTNYVKYKASEPSYAKIRTTDNIAKKSSTVREQVASGQGKSSVSAKAVSDVIAKDNVRSVNSRQFIDFGGAIYQGNEDNLFAYIGAKETNSFSIIGQAVAGALEETSCVYDEPSVTTSLYKVSEKTLSTTDYLPGMNRTAWWGKVNEHGIGMAPLAVDRSTLDITENPTISVYKNYSSNRQAKPMKTAKMVDVNIYNGSEGVIYRAFIKDKNYPIKCIDIAVDKKHKNGTFNAFAGKIYYQGPKGLMMADYKPGKA
ncbi:OmpA family protein [Vibrio japonicus]|uniref:OmpA family protein n=1 Tax=Vibrio japonicus TaxID=1824638 RepID=A0ABY5LKG9_9VIBR|nr:OmpA family protein [Vibrio japonicus]UUM31916.1 OmpA family protein [Vibrio japonicus]